jgi:hypothetical protein
MRTTITLPDPLLRNAKKYAEDRRMTLSTLVEDALRCRLALQPQQPRAEFRLHTVSGKIANPDLNLDRTSSLLAAEDEERFRNANARR